MSESIPVVIDRCAKRRAKRIEVRGNGVGADLGGLERCVHVEELFVANCGLRAVPDCIAKLPKLRILSVVDNPIAELPDWISSVPMLETLDFGQTHAREIPEWVGKLKNLKLLWGVAARIDCIRGDWSKLKHLEDVRLSENPLRTFPECLFTPTTLKDSGSTPRA